MRQVRIVLLCFALAGLNWACGSKPGRANRSLPRVKPAAIDASMVSKVTGTIFFHGDPPHLPPILMDKDPACVKLYHGQRAHVVDGEVNSNGTLPNVFVYVEKGGEQYVFTPPTQPAVLDQQGCMFKPHVLGLMVGQVLEVKNSDPTTHNVHTLAKNNPQWNISQVPGAPPLEERFLHPEIMVPLACSQHPWMTCYLGVTSNPFYAVTGSEGTYALKGLPPGAYTIAAWTATFGTKRRQTTVGPKQTIKLNFTFGAYP